MIDGARNRVRAARNAKTPEDMSRGWTVKKRDGRVSGFDPDKVRQALLKCFASLLKDGVIDETHEIFTTDATGRLTRAVVNTLHAEKNHQPTVEDVQRLVIQQLWGAGYFEAAEHYQNYREERRRLRAQKPIPADVADRVAEDQKHFPTDLQYYQFMGKFSRWREADRRRETWQETCDERVLPWLHRQVEGRLEPQEKADLRSAMFNLEASPAMRVVQMAGPALDRCHIGVYNCAAMPLEDLKGFAELLYILMQGSGCGFSVESEYVNELPRVKKQKSRAKKDTIVVDDTTESWCDSYFEGLVRWFDGYDVDFNTDRVRKQNTRLKTKGGRACLTGDTVVYKDRKKSTGENTLTVAQLYEKRVKTPRRLKHIKIRCLDEATGRFVRNRVVDVIDNGVADVYEVTTENGYRIKATSNHRFMNRDRVYQHLDLFSEGDLIAVNGTRVDAKRCHECGRRTNRHGLRCEECFRKDPTCVDCGAGLSRLALRCPECREKAGRCADCGVAVSRHAERCRPCADEAQIRPDASGTTARARKACQSANTGVCALCDRDDLETQVHHKDRNPHNNQPENLMTLCEPCHRVLHATEDTFGNPYAHKYLSFDRIVSIRRVGRERVYDLCMQAPNHNFVANGFVSHNSGPGPLLELLAFARNMVMARQGRYLEDTDCHRLACMTGRIVQVGGVRRASCISLSDLMSVGMRHLKSGAWWADKTYWTDGKYLSMANNSAVYEERPPIDVFMDEWLALVKSKAGERGIFNREAAISSRPSRRKKARFICNPCAEILLRPYGLCNLSIAVARPDDTVESLRRKVRLAALFGVIQSTCTDFNYVRDDWRKNAEEERLLGVDITGHADCPLLQFGAPGRAELLRMLRADVAEQRVKYSQRFGIPQSAADTCIKPGGDSGVFFDCSSGISDRFADYQIRWVREGKDSPVSQFLIDSGVPYAPAPENPEALYVFGFPKKSPPGSHTRNRHTAIEQAEMWLETKKNWAEHSVSATLYVEDHEWLELGAWIYKQEHWEHLTGLSFLPKDNGTYTYAPNEELSADAYREFEARFPSLNWAKLQQYEHEDMTGAAQTLACVAGGCD
jgi:5-methylcytosine-specific restriction endonuclease McrA